MESWVVSWMLLAVLPAAIGDVTIMKDVTLGFGQALKHCREESHLTEEKMEDFFHFWRDDFKFVDHELGCAFLCMSNHYNLLTDTSRMHHEKTDAFIRSFPNGEKIAQKLTKIIHTCELEFDSIDDHCDRILRIAECFKKACKDNNIAPEMEFLMAEFIMVESEAQRRR